MAPDRLIALMVFIFGASVGSFVGVVAYRLPLGQSIVRPRSFCPACENPIPAWANVPIIGYFIVRGRCYRCGASIPIRDLLAEIALGFVALYLFLNFPVADAAARFVFCAALFAVAMIDLDRWRIPLIITLPGIAIGLFAATVMIPETGFVSSITGIVAGAGFLFIVGEVYRKIRGRDGIGLGDVWLIGMVGAFLGWPGVLFTLFAGSLLGSIGGLVYAIAGRVKTPRIMPSDEQSDENGLEDSATPDSILLTAIPFGPFLALAAAIFALFQPQLSDWYLLG